MVYGPVPKRSEERIRRNKDVVEIDNVEMIGTVEVPDLGLDSPHPMISDFYESLQDSGQSKYYEPSDWQFARITCHFLNGLIKAGAPSAVMLATVSSMLTELLVSEGSRRRVRLEIERESQKQELADVASMFKERLAQ